MADEARTKGRSEDEDEVRRMLGDDGVGTGLKGFEAACSRAATWLKYEGVPSEVEEDVCGVGGRICTILLSAKSKMTSAF